MSGVQLRNHSRLLASTHQGFLSPGRRCPSCLSAGLLSRRGHASSAASFPRVAQPSLWQSIIPKFLRQSRPSAPVAKSPRSKEWDPATFFIIIYLLIGSNAIQMIAVKNDFANFNRKTDSKIALLKEAIERVRNGEEVDVERLLGSGDPEEEQEWAAVIRAIEEEDRLWRSKGKKGDQKPASNSPEDGSMQDLAPPEKSEVDTKITPRKNGSHSDDWNAAGVKSSASIPQNFH